MDNTKLQKKKKDAQNKMKSEINNHNNNNL